MVASRPRIGLVLGAGGTRGCAHAGVIEVLAGADIPVDVVVGASAGSIFGLGLAAGCPVEYIAAVARDATAWHMFRFYAGRLRAAGRSNPIARMLRDAGEGKTFADLPRTFAVRATDMATGRPILIDHGPVLPAVEASIALPMIARPVPHAGSYCMDGGLFETAPVETARQLGADIVIAVCLGFNYVAPGFLRARPWTRPVLERLGTQRTPIRGGLGDQLRFGCRLFAASYGTPRPTEGADVAIWPEFGSVTPNSLFGARFCFEQGVAAARDALPLIDEAIGRYRPGADESIPVA
ncbi:MAG TPA: patatin-like phospholipase family protein [Chloroflexota bacterium]|nr:patatin-like phospholipase family protein [Chloroflexota bacterium]